MSQPAPPQRPSDPAAPHGHSVEPALGASFLSAPWRLEYIESIGKDESAAKPSSAAPARPSSGSFLRDYWLDPASDQANHVILRAAFRDPAKVATTSEPAGAAPEVAGMILLNAFPYANGHLLVALGDPRPTLLDYTPVQRAALWQLTDLAAALMQAALEPQGINIGLNQGRAAGAGVPGHLHVHLVPRWHGDVNFMTVVGRIRVIPSSLDMMATRYREAWERLRPKWKG